MILKNDSLYPWKMLLACLGSFYGLTDQKVVSDRLTNQGGCASARACITISGMCQPQTVGSRI